MTERIILRATAGDLASLKLAAQQQGLDVSALIRSVLIKERYITPLG